MEEKNKKSSTGAQIFLKELIDLNEWQKLQDMFSNVANISIRTVDANGGRLTRPSLEPRLCTELIKTPHIKTEICEKCLPTFLGGKSLVDKNLSFSCVAGLQNFLVPLRLPDSRVLGYVIFGPVILVIREAKEEYRNIAEELNVDLEDFWNAILEIKVLSFDRVQKIIELIKNFGEYILKLAYQDITLDEEIKAVMASASTQLNKLFNALLDVAMQVSQADIGSIMLLDKSAEELTIRSSYGLPEQVVKSAKVRIGEGISGTAAKEDKSLLIGQTSPDNRIKSYLNRPSIASSIVVPIKLKDRVLGVINLAALQASSVRFNVDNVKAINRLVDLATVAFETPIK